MCKKSKQSFTVAVSSGDSPWFTLYYFDSLSYNKLVSCNVSKSLCGFVIGLAINSDSYRATCCRFSADFRCVVDLLNNMLNG